MPTRKMAPVDEVLKRLGKAYPEAGCTLDFKNPLQLMVATILSAQCTDKRVNVVTPEVFSKYRTAEDYAAADVEQLQGAVRSTGFFRNKARSIQGACRRIVERHGGQVPTEMAALVALPGVGQHGPSAGRRGGRYARGARFIATRLDEAERRRQSRTRAERIDSRERLGPRGSRIDPARPPGLCRPQAEV